MTAIQSSENLSECVERLLSTHPHKLTTHTCQSGSKTVYKFPGSTPNFPTNTQSKLSRPRTIVLSRLKMTTRREGLIIPPLSIIKAALSLKICASSTWYLSEL